MTAKAAAAGVKPTTRAYVTLLAGDGDESCRAVVGLAKRLREVGSAYPLVVAVLPDVPDSRRRSLISEGCIVREIEPAFPPEKQTQFAAMAADYVINHSKLRIWEFVEYERVVYLDANIEVVPNVDELFDLDLDLEKGCLYAVAVKNSSGEKAWSHSTPPHQCKIGCFHPSSDDVAALVPPSSSEPLYFNAAGMFVCKPSMATAKALLLDALSVGPRTPTADHQDDFLNRFFGEQYKPILLDNKLGVKMPQPQFSNWLTAAKEMMLARENLPALAALAASSAAAGVVATAGNPAICFGFYAALIAAIALLTTSLGAI